MARAHSVAADDLADLDQFGTCLVAQLATVEARQGWTTPTTASLAERHLATVRKAMRLWAEGLTPPGIDLSCMWTRSLVLPSPLPSATAVPRVTIAQLGRVYERLLALAPTWDAASRTVVVGSAPGHARRRSGSYYTPPRLVASIVDAVLGPLLADAACAPDPEAALLSLRILDPACGSGHFLLAVADRLAMTLAAARGLSDAGSRERSDIAQHCLYGVDLDATAVDLCRATVWQWCGFDTKCAQAIHAHMRWGNALLGLGPRSEDAPIQAGIPDCAYKATAADGPATARALRRQNALARSDPQLQHALTAMRDPRHAEAVWLAHAWCAAFTLPKTSGAGVPTNADLACVVRGIPVSEELRAAVLGSSLRYRYFHWRLAFPEVFHDATTGFDALVGNPPYLNQLRMETAAERSAAELLRFSTNGFASGYADTAAAFWARVPELLRPGGRAGLIVPHSLLVTADTGPLRRHLLQYGTLRGIWIAGERAFADAEVMTCAPIWQRNAVAAPRSADSKVVVLPRWAGADGAPTSPLPLDSERLSCLPTWGALAADLLGIPAVPFATGATLARWATATADFRDQYYGLDGFVVDQNSSDPWLFAPLVTSGLLDLAVCLHGLRPTRLHKRTWIAPCVDVGRMRREGALGPWLALRQVPKILVATQTPVVEVWVDVVGATVPSVPVLTVVPNSRAGLWTVAAALASPVTSAWAATHHAGAALALGALKLSATQLMDVPLPDATSADWAAAVRAMQAAHAATESGERAAQLHVFGRAAVRCHGLDEPTATRILRWWLRRAGLG